MANSFKLTGDWYVDGIGGDDADAGTINAPFKTINAAITAASNGQKIIIGTGVYNEQISTLTSYYYFYADGNVIMDASGLSEDTCIWTCRNDEFHDIHFVNMGQIYGLNSTSYRPRFYNCIFTNSGKMLNTSTYSTYNWNTYILEFHSCRFQDCDLSFGPGRYQIYVRYYDCVFMNSPLGVDVVGGGTSVSNYYWDIKRCWFGRSDGVANPCLLYYRWYSSNGQFLEDCYFQAGGTITSYNVTSATTYTSESISTFLTNNAGTKNIGTSYIVATGSYNTNISGANTFNAAQSTLQAGNNSVIFFNKTQPAFSSFIGNQPPTTAYGWSGSAANILHTDGGATWNNIIEQSSSLRISSSAAGPTGSITSTTMDMGQVKPITYIRSSWTSTLANTCAPAVYSSSILNQYPTRYTFEMKNGNTSDLSSEPWKIYCFDEIPYISTNGSGSGDMGFLTSSYNSIDARYLQFKITLRTNLTGST